MAILKVARMGNPVLRRVADPIPPEEISSPAVQGLIRDMVETVVEYDGLGLAAPQVHASMRLVILLLDPEAGFEVWINPVVTVTSEKSLVTTEGCLSVPGLRGDVARPGEIRVDALDHTGQPIRVELAGFPAAVAQHECDHLDGVLYVDKADTRTLTFLEEFRRYASATEGEEE